LSRDAQDPADTVLFMFVAGAQLIYNDFLCHDTGAETVLSGIISFGRRSMNGHEEQMTTSYHILGIDIGSVSISVSEVNTDGDVIKTAY